MLLFRTKVLPLLLFLGAVLAGKPSYAQSPELALREFASGQIKKGVRSIGFGGDGATWGNYALVYRDSGSALLDYGVTAYTNGNTFSFTAVGFTSPQLWHGLAIYAIALSQHATGIDLSLNGGNGIQPYVHGSGANEAVFIKAAMPLGAGWSVGALLSYELSQFNAVEAESGAPIQYETQWRPSGGFGVAWQPIARLLVGSRVIINHDWEIRRSDSGVKEGMASTYEVRLGGSASPWSGALIDAGGTLLVRSNEISGRHTTTLEPNLGFEQTLLAGHLALRAGLDETSPGAGLTARFRCLKLDIAYIHNLAMSRVGTLFGTASNSVLATLSYDYQKH
jgi:hypothetical protein